MKHFLPVIWWLAAVPVIALVITSLGYPFGAGCALAVMFLPGMLAARYFFPQLSFENRRKGVLDCIWLILAILVSEYMCIMLANAYVNTISMWQIPSILLNPVFLLLVLTAFVAPEMMLERYLAAKHPYDETISFVSDRRKITLDPAQIACIESNDSEVWIHTLTGTAYRTKTRISQWEGQLDGRFLRIHRSFIINTQQIAEYTGGRILIGGRNIEVSRKYKDEVRRRLCPESESLAE